MQEISLPRKRRDLAALVGSKIRSFRLERGWTEADLATVLRLPRAYVERYEAGLMLPRTYTLYQLSLAFGITLGSLIDEPARDSVNTELVRSLRRLQALLPRHRTVVVEFLETLLSTMERLS